MINKIVLENFKSHSNSTINFERGYNVVIGNMGSGKSSIVDAITFALFGTTQSIISRKIQVKDLITQKPLVQSNAKIVLDFSVDNNIYSVQREIFDKKSSQAKLFLDEKLIAGPKPQDVNEEIQKILGIDIDVFMRANYSEQNQIDFFLNMPASTRKQLFDSLFGIDFYEKISTNSRKVANNIDTKEQIEKEKILQLIPIIKNTNIKETEKTKKELLSKLEIEEELSKNAEKKLAKLKEEYDSLRKLKEEYDRVSDSIKEIRSKINYILKEYNFESIDKDISIKEEEEELNKIKQEYKKYNERKNLVLKLTERVKNIEEYIKKTSLKIKDDLNKSSTLKAEEIEKLIKDINEKLESIQKDANKQESENMSLKSDIKRAIEEIEKLKKLGSKCPTCHQDLNEEHILNIQSKTNKSISEKNIIIERNSKEINTITERIVSLKKQYENLQKALYDAKEIELRIKRNKEIKEEIEKYKIEVRENKKKIDENKIDEKTDFEKLIKEKERQVENTKKYLELEALKKEELVAREKLSKINFNEEKLEGIRENYIELESSAKYKKTIIAQNKKLIEDAEDKIRKYLKLEEDKGELEKRQKELEKISKDLRVFGLVSRKTQEQVRELLVSNVNDIFMDLWPKIYPYDDFEKIKLNIIKGDYKLELYFSNNVKRPLDDFVSGGERSAIALTLRIAMSILMKNKLGLMILDEPTHNLDKNSVFAISNLFNEHLSNFTKQIIVITHDKQLEERAKNIITVTRDKENDKPSIVNKISFN